MRDAIHEGGTEPGANYDWNINGFEKRRVVQGVAQSNGGNVFVELAKPTRYGLRSNALSLGPQT